MMSPTTPLRLVTADYATEPGVDTAIDAVLVGRASDGLEPQTLRLYRPGRVVAFGRQDVTNDGYAAAVTATRVGGFEAVERLAGGRAAVFTSDTVAFSWAIPDPDPRSHTEARFRMVSSLMRDALRALGVDAHIGEIPGEYCPGRFSVNAGGTHKLVGVGQRLRRHAAYVGGVVVVDSPDAIVNILDPVYSALGVSWRPETTGAVAGVVPGVGFDTVVSAITTCVSERYPIEPSVLNESIVAEARHLAPSRIP